MNKKEYSSNHEDLPTGLYKYNINERQDLITNALSLSSEDLEVLRNPSSLSLKMADQLIENVIGVYGLPMGIATNFIIDGKSHLIPMVTEESSVIAAASKAAKIVALSGGFTTQITDPIMTGQIQVTQIPNTWKLKDIEKILVQHRNKIEEIARDCDPILYDVGGGLRQIETKEINTSRGKMFIIEFHVNVKNAMGANIINTMAEAFASYIQPIIPGKILLRIISNLSIHRLATARATFNLNKIADQNISENILDAYAFAEADPFRATTHNKGIMNGVSALAMATGNDTRAIEASAHAFAAISGNYKPLSRYSLTPEGKLLGELTMPVPFGIIGGITNYHPSAKLALKILDIQSADDLGKIAVAVGLAQNFAAMLALVSEGIQRGHMRLHGRK